MPIDFHSIDKSVRPLYRGLADELARQIEVGDLRPGERLLTQEELSKLLGIARATVCRAYQELGNRRLVTSEIGRGTFVKEMGGGFRAPLLPGDENHDSINLAIDTGAVRGWRSEDSAFKGFAASVETGPNAIRSKRSLRSRLAEAGSSWLARHGLECPNEAVFPCIGHHHSILLGILATTATGDYIATDRWTYPGLHQIAAVLERRVVQVDIDDHGSIPESLENVCRRYEPKVVYLTPTLHSPCNFTIPAHRRLELVQVLHRFNLPFIEDDTYRLLTDQPPKPLTTHLPDQGIYLAGFSKLVCSEPQIEFAAVPTQLRRRFEEASWITVSAVPRSSALLGSALVESGIADEGLTRVRSLIRDRLRIASRHLGTHLPPAPPLSPCLWLELSAGPSSESIAARAREAGVAILASTTFLGVRAKDCDEDAVQICLTGTDSLADLRLGLEVVADLLGQKSPLSVPSDRDRAAKAAHVDRL